MSERNSKHKGYNQPNIISILFLSGTFHKRFLYVSLLILIGVISFRKMSRTSLNVIYMVVYMSRSASYNINEVMRSDQFS